MSEFMLCKYTAKDEYGKKSSIKMINEMLPIELHQMIVWIMFHAEQAEALLPDYRRIRFGEQQEDGE